MDTIRDRSSCSFTCLFQLRAEGRPPELGRFTRRQLMRVRTSTDSRLLGLARSGLQRRRAKEPTRIRTTTTATRHCTAQPLMGAKKLQASSDRSSLTRVQTWEFATTKAFVCRFGLEAHFISKYRCPPPAAGIPKPTGFGLHCRLSKLTLPAAIELFNPPSMEHHVAIVLTGIASP